jgi:Bacterial PH domain
MIWSHLIARLVFLIGFVVVMLLFFGNNHDRQGKARFRNDGRIEFTQNGRAFWGWLLVTAYLGYAAIHRLQHSHGRPLDLLISVCVGTVALTLSFSLPGTIAVTADGVEQVFWLRKNKYVRWADIVEINTGEKSRTVTILGADGTKIVHSRQLADRSRLLLELKQHCGENLPPDFPREAVAGF